MTDDYTPTTEHDPVDHLIELPGVYDGSCTECPWPLWAVGASEIAAAFAQTYDIYPKADRKPADSGEAERWAPARRG